LILPLRAQGKRSTGSIAEAYEGALVRVALSVHVR
jgi:hypothetical protein